MRYKQRSVCRAESERIAKAPDFLIFEPRVYMAFVESGVIHDDVITFKTVFGAELSASYVKRRPRAYMGYRKCCENGKVEYLRQDAPPGHRPASK